MKTWILTRIKDGKRSLISKSEWLDYLSIDKTIVRYVDTIKYITSGSTFLDNAPYAQTVWREPNSKSLYDNVHFCFDDHTGVFARIYINNSKSVSKVLKVAKYFKVTVLEGDKKINQKYLNDVLDDESGPQLEW